MTLHLAILKCVCLFTDAGISVELTCLFTIYLFTEICYQNSKSTLNHHRIIKLDRWPRSLIMVQGTGKNWYIWDQMKYAPSMDESSFTVTL